jgi:hypothetical protein
LIAALVPSIAGIGVPWATKSTSGKVRDGMLIATAPLKVQLQAVGELGGAQLEFSSLESCIRMAVAD